MRLPFLGKVKMYGQGAFTQSEGNQVMVNMEPGGPFEGSGVFLNASADTGIVASDDGAGWDGVAGLELPFG